MAAFFITGTGTEIGKTFVTAGLIRAMRRKGRAVEAYKPVVSGFDPAQPAGSDPAELLAALGRPISPDALDRLSPWRFRAPLSPDMAARREERRIDFAALLDHCRAVLAGAGDIALFEGVGGVMVPLDEKHTVLDWMAALRLPVILVAGSYLGTISHTLTALDVLARRDLAVRALVVSETVGATVSLDETIRTLVNFAPTLPMLALPRLDRAGEPHPAFDRLAALLT